ncbi:hypothetical protein [Corallococcus sp. 4LFB]|uniref:hypothetical protein n=1 Tax=Corallococcus sp. 4LFB TaxID=3383249 RepID=UPI003975EBDB
MPQASTTPLTLDASRIDPNALAILERLRGAGFQALLVGGCVRDLLLGQTPKDFDIATDARADQTHGLFEECLMLGGRGSVMTLVFQGGKPFDVATLRPLRTPASTPRVPLDADLLAVARELPVGTVAQDAASRDFSVNALFHDPATGQTLDFVGGVADVRAHVLRSLGEPSARFRDDPSLVYRALRICARRGLTIEPRTLEALREGVAALPDSPFALRLHELLECLGLGVAEAACAACSSSACSRGRSPPSGGWGPSRGRGCSRSGSPWTGSTPRRACSAIRHGSRPSCFRSRTPRRCRAWTRPCRWRNSSRRKAARSGPRWWRTASRWWRRNGCCGRAPAARAQRSCSARTC